MTWSLQNTINWAGETGTEDHNTAWAYFFDTFMSTVSTWYVTPWPSTQPDYRKLKITLNNKYNNNAAYNMYFSIRIGDPHFRFASMDTGFKVLIDARYTNAPQDRDNLLDFDTNVGPAQSWALINGAASGQSYSGGWVYPDAASTGSGPYKFWISSEDNDARLVTKGRRVIFYWPGWTSGYFYEDSSWDGTTNNQGQHIFGIVYSSNGDSTDRFFTNLSYSEPNGIIENNIINNDNGIMTDGRGVLLSKPPSHVGWDLHDAAANEQHRVVEIPRRQGRADTPITPSVDYSTTQKSLLLQGISLGGVGETAPTFDAITRSDVAIYSPYNKASTVTWFSPEQGEVARINGGDYWLLAAPGTVTETLAFNFGSTQPSFS